MAHKPLVISTILLLLTAIASTHYFQKFSKKSDEQEIAATHYDMFGHNVMQTGFDANGLRSSTSQSVYVTHYPVGQYSLFKKPHMIIPNATSPLVITADSGKNINANNTTYFTDHVIITQSATKQTPKMVITTTHGTAYPARSLATTDAFITIDRGMLHLTGVGASIDSKKGITQIYAQVRGQYTPLKQAPYYFSSNTLIYYNKTHTLILDGHVTIDQIATHITGDHLVVSLTPNNKVISAIDTGHPATYHTSDKIKATTLNAAANTITYRPATQLIYLDGNATVDQNHDTISASHIIYDKTHDSVQTHHSKTEQPITHIVIMPQKKTPGNTTPQLKNQMPLPIAH